MHKGSPWGTHQITGAAGSLCCCWEESLKNLQWWRNAQGLPLEGGSRCFLFSPVARNLVSGSKGPQLTSEIQVQHLPRVLSADPHYLGLPGSQLLMHIVCGNSGFTGLLSVPYQTGSDKGKSVNLGGLEHKKRWCSCYGLVQGSGETTDRVLRLPSHPQVSVSQGILHWRKYSQGQQADSSEFQSPTPNDTQYRWPCGQCGVCTTQAVGQSCSEFNCRLPPFYPVRVNSETRSRHPQTNFPKSLLSSYWSQGGPKCVSNPWQLRILLV